jgi:methionine-rich copper-binding protein CopC
MRLISVLAAALVMVPAAGPASAALPAPELTAITPADESEIGAPLSEVTLTFATTVDLVEVALVTPDQRRFMLHDAFNGDPDRKGDSFVLPLPEAVSLPGAYVIEIAASVTDPADGSASTMSVHSSFTLADPPVAEDQAAEAPE